MAEPKKYIDMLSTNPIPMLLEKAPLPVQYATVKRFTPEETSRIENLYEELQHSSELAKILKSQQSDGLWKLKEKFSIEERQKAMLFLNQLKVMNRLHDFGCEIDISEVQRGLIALLKMQKPDGKFPLMMHHHGLALWLLVRYGLTGNPFVERGFRWVVKRQHSDGGWLSPSMLPAGLPFKSAKSCIWTTLIILQALSIHSRLRTSVTCQRASEFLLENYLNANDTTLFPDSTAWDYLYTDYTDNGLFRGGTLRFVEVFSDLPDTHRHPRFKKAVNWLIEQQLPSGLFPAVAGKSTDGDYFVTYRVIKALDAIG